MKKHTNIFRIDTGHTHGWQVRIRRRGEMNSAFFSDSKFESKEAGLQAALEKRDAMLDDLPPKQENDPDFKEEVDERRWRAVTSTGVRGLGFTMKLNNSTSDKHQPHVSGHWCDDDGTWHTISRSIYKYGLEDAIREVATHLVEVMDHEMTVDEMVETALPAITAQIPKEHRKHIHDHPLNPRRVGSASEDAS